MNNYLKMEISALSENEGFARAAVSAFALPLNPTLSQLSDVKTAVSEAVTNCIVHAYSYDGAGIITIECRITGSSLHITVSDKGKGIADVSKAVQPFFTTLEGDERSGMGFTIMQSFMNGLKVTSALGKGTKVYMYKDFALKNA